MAKAPKTAYVCNDCGAEFSRWQGQCSACKAWNTISEVRLISASNSTKNDRFSGYAGETRAKIQTLSEISLQETPRFTSGFKELDRVLGGGIVPGSAILIGGHPGAGKSTLLLQVMCGLAKNMTALYVTGEESLQQVAMRANRLNLPTDKLNMLSETSVEQICNLADQLKPQIIVVDSIQVMHLSDIQSSPGSVAQGVNVPLFLLVMRRPDRSQSLWLGMSPKTAPLRGQKYWSMPLTVHYCWKGRLIPVSVRYVVIKTVLAQ